jgi:DUF1680 family protein
MNIDIMKRIVLLVFVVAGTGWANAQSHSLVNTGASPYAKLKSADLHAVHWTNGFWADRMKVCRDSMVPHLWDTYMDPNVSHAFKNFEIAAGLDTGSHKGPSFHDGDFYKLLESVAALYAQTKDKQLDEMMDKAIAVIAKAQRPDGYIYTYASIQQQKTGKQNQFEDRLSFEAYNLGHLMTTACVHYRATGKRTLLDIAIKAADYLYAFYKKASPTLARNAICPSHYMGVVELYRTTNDKKYLELAQHLIDIKGQIDDGTDDNQDRVPFRQQTKAMGHAVRANYLYAGVADLYAETGEDSLIKGLQTIWADMVYRKMYITGGCGALYDGVSPYGTSYKPPVVQKTHQAFGRDFQLPNMTAHNETCANIGNMLFNWRMLLITEDAKYADVLEQALYNSVLSGISLDGNKFFYTNPLSASNQFPYDLRWSGGRKRYISLSNCCPPNTVRTIAEVSNYAYSISDNGIYCNLYGGNTFQATLAGNNAVKISQVTDYPWNGLVKLTVDQTKGDAFSIFLRIPGWCKTAGIKVNGKAIESSALPGTYAEIKRSWKAGDIIELDIPMNVAFIEANPLVEETRGQVAVKRGPIVYCLESTDLPANESVFDIVFSDKTQLKPSAITIEQNKMMALTGEAAIKPKTNWNNQLYKEVNPAQKNIAVKLIPYYAWANRGHSEMTVWVPYR